MSLEEEGQTRGMSVTAWIIEHKKKDNLHLERTDLLSPCGFSNDMFSLRAPRYVENVVSTHTRLQEL